MQQNGPTDVNANGTVMKNRVIYYRLINCILYSINAYQDIMEMYIDLRI